MGEGLKEKYMQLCVKLLSMHENCMFDAKTNIAEINRVIKTGAEIRVNSSLYNKVILMNTYAKIIFRYTTSLEKFSSCKSEVKDAEKSIKELYKEMQDFDSDPDEIAVYVRCAKDKMRNMIKELKHVSNHLGKIIDELEREVAMTTDNYKITMKLVKIYTIRANTVSMMINAIKIMLKYKE